MSMIDLNASRVRHCIIANELTIPSKDNITIACLTAIEMTGASYTAVMGQMRWRLVIIPWYMMPVHNRLSRGDGVEHPWWKLVRGPHLPTYRLDGNTQPQPHADLSTPGPSSNDQYTGNERIVGSLDQVRVIRPLLYGRHGILRADACAVARRRGGEGARGLFGIGLRAPWHVHTAQESGV